MEEQKRNLFAHKVQSQGVPSLNVDASIGPNLRLFDDHNFHTRPTTLLDSVKLVVEEHPPAYNTTAFEHSKADANVSNTVVEEADGSIDVYFDAVIQSPVEMITDCELCFCLQREGEVL